MHKHNSGRSIVEVMGYAMVAILIATGMFRAYALYNTRIQRASARAQIQSLAESASHAIYGRRNVPAPLTARLAERGRNTLDPWGRPIEISNGANCIEIEFSGVSRANCIYLANAIPSGCRGHITSVNGATTEIRAYGHVGFVGECDQAENTVRWFFAR